MMHPMLYRALGLVWVSAIVMHVPTLAAAQDRNQAAAGELPVVIAVRHAEVARASASEGNPPLSAAGAARARELGAVLRDASVGAIITTEFRRTRDTAAPLAAAVGVQLETVSGPASLSEHIGRLEQAVRGHAGGVVLVVGHSDTVPSLIAALGGPAMPAICEAVFDNLFTLFALNGNVHVIRARYGAASPRSAPECR